MSATEELIHFMTPRMGTEIYIGDWLEIDQNRIDRFAEVTGDVQWIHVDPERARRESPYKTTIAHGYLTLSLLPYLTQSNHPDFFQSNYPGMSYRVNYGVNRVRFPSPVKSGDRVRARMTLQSAEPAGKAVQIIYVMTIDVDGSEKPACICEQVVRVFP
jgi:acyl dehydratase